MWMPVFPAIFKSLAGNLLSVNAGNIACNTVASNTIGNIARCGFPLKVKSNDFRDHAN